MGRRAQLERVAAEEAGLRRAALIFGVVAVSIFLLAAGLKVYAPVQADASAAFRTGLKAGLLAFALLAGARSALRRRATALGAILGLVVSLCLGVGGTLVGNAWLDRGTGRRRRVKVIRAETSQAGGKRRSWIVIESWTKPGAQETISTGAVVQPALVESLSPGDELELTTMPGRFGYEWLSGAAKVSR